MSALTLLLVGLLAVAGAGLAGLHTLIEFAERRRRIRWAHTLARFCGDPACRLCQSRRLSHESPRRVVRRSARLVGG